MDRIRKSLKQPLTSVKGIKGTVLMRESRLSKIPDEGEKRKPSLRKSSYKKSIQKKHTKKRTKNDRIENDKENNLHYEEAKADFSKAELDQSSLQDLTIYRDSPGKLSQLIGVHKNYGLETLSIITAVEARILHSPQSL